jgi:hypothetical protein
VLGGLAAHGLSRFSEQGPRPRRGGGRVSSWGARALAQPLPRRGRERRCCPPCVLGSRHRGQGMRPSNQLVTITSASRYWRTARSPRRRAGAVYGAWSSWVYGSRLAVIAASLPRGGGNQSNRANTGSMRLGQEPRGSRSSFRGSPAGHVAAGGAAVGRAVRWLSPRAPLGRPPRLRASPPARKSARIQGVELALANYNEPAREA